MATAFQANAFQASPAFQIDDGDVVEAVATRGAFYPTPEELKRLRRELEERRRRG
jgi:hypothetical protein